MTNEFQMGVMVRSMWQLPIEFFNLLVVIVLFV